MRTNRTYFTYEEYFSAYKKHFIIAESYTNIVNFKNILYSCRFLPYNIDSNRKMKDHWVDGMGNSIYFGNNNYGSHFKLNNLTRFIESDPRLDKSRIIDTDSYCLLEPSKLLKMSDKIYICLGHEEDLNCASGTICFTGIDKVVRCFMILGSEWLKICPLRFGTDFVNMMISNTIFSDPGNYSVLPIYNQKSWMVPKLYSGLIDDISKFGIVIE